MGLFSKIYHSILDHHHQHHQPSSSTTAQGAQTAEDDETWRPSKDNALDEYEDEILEGEEMDVERPKAKEHSPSGRVSPQARRKKAARRQDDDDDDDDAAWKPTDEDIEDEEIEVQDMLNYQPVEEELHEEEQKKGTTPKKQSSPRKKPTSRKKPVGRPAHQDDDTWKPEGEELDDEEAIDEDSPYEDSADDEQPAADRRKPAKKTRRKKPVGRPTHQDDDTWRPEGEDLDDEQLADEDSLYEDSADDEQPAAVKRTPPRKAKKRPATSSAGSPMAHRTKPAKISPPSPEAHQASGGGMSPKHRLTTATNKKPPAFLVKGENENAPFTFAAYRGEGMVMLAMNWKDGTPPDNFVGWVIEYTEPGSSKWWPIPNYCTFPGAAATSGPDDHSSRLSPIQRFRWIHFPYNIDNQGYFRYRVTPVFMTGEGDDEHSLSYGEIQEVKIQLIAETLPGQMNIAFTRGFVSSKAFMKKYGANGVGDILPAKADEGLDFKPKDPELEEKALAWMGFEARQVLLSAIDAAIQDTTAEVRMLAYDFNDPEIVLRLQKLGRRVKIIIDDSSSHEKPEDAESKAAAMLERTAGKGNVQRQHMGGLQHNKVLVVDGANTQIAIGGSTNFSWRGLYVQNNNLVALQGRRPVEVFKTAFDNYWDHPNDTDGFYKTESAEWNDLGLSIDAQVTFSPHSSKAGTLAGIAADIKATESTLFYSLAFLYETPGVIREAIEKKVSQKGVMVYGLSDKSVEGLDVRHNANPPIAYPEELGNESAGGSGARMHHKFVVIDFNTPAARVYTGSHNFSNAADTKNAENLFLIRDARVATAYMIEAVAMFDHYEVRDHIAQKKKAEAKGERHAIHLRLPPSGKGDEKPWWDQYWSVKQKIQDREMFGV